MPEDPGGQGMAEELDTIACYPKRLKLKQCQNYRAISLISHPSKIMLQVILNRLKAKPEALLAKAQAGFRPGPDRVKQIFDSPVNTEKHLQLSARSVLPLHRLQ